MERKCPGCAEECGGLVEREVASKGGLSHPRWCWCCAPKLGRHAPTGVGCPTRVVRGGTLCPSNHLGGAGWPGREVDEG